MPDTAANLSLPLPQLLPPDRIQELRNWGFHDAADALSSVKPFLDALKAREVSISKALGAIHGEL